MIQPLWKTVWKFLEKLVIKLPYYPAIPLLGIYLRKPKLKKTHVTQCSIYIELHVLLHCYYLHCHNSNVTMVM